MNNVMRRFAAVSLAISSCSNIQYVITQQSNGVSNFPVYSCVGRELVDESHNSKQNNCIKVSSSAYASNKNVVEAKKMTIDNRWQYIYEKNIEKLKYMKTLEDNWEAGAKCFSGTLIDKIIVLIGKLNYFQPNVFPKYDSRIQLEFYDMGERHLQLVLSEEMCELYYTDGLNFDNDVFEEFEYDETSIMRYVNIFYGNNLYERTIRSTTC